MDTEVMARPLAIAIIGNHPPRRCGIATFTADLADALTAVAPRCAVCVVALDDSASGYPYPDRVAHMIAQHDPTSYRRAAHWLNARASDIVLLQHEYGIFGGVAGEYVLPLLRGLRAPIVTTCHTVLARPDPAQRRVLAAIGRLSARVIVMSERGATLLREVYGVPGEKIALIHHGIPDLPASDTGPHKTALGLAGRQILLTFGLLSPGKGLSAVLRVLPPVVARHPEVLYLVHGATHPQVKAQQGESYREHLHGLAHTLGIARQVRLMDRFATPEEVRTYLQAADIYLTPYPGREQITSGTLAYAVGAGKAVVSTPYPYATELLAEGRGLLVPFDDDAAITRALLALLDDTALRLATGHRAYRFGRGMTWPQVARRYLACFAPLLGEGRHSRQYSCPPSGYIDTPRTVAGDSEF